MWPDQVLNLCQNSNSFNCHPRIGNHAQNNECTGQEYKGWNLYNVRVESHYTWADVETETGGQGHETGAGGQGHGLQNFTFKFFIKTSVKAWQGLDAFIIGPKYYIWATTHIKGA